MSLLRLQEQLKALDPARDEFASSFVEHILQATSELGASDLHLQPKADGLRVQFRIDGVLHFVGCFPPGLKTDVVTRLKVLAQLLTYRTDGPQEGRIPGHKVAHDLRVCTFPTVFGERAVVRSFQARDQFLYPEDLGLPHETEAMLQGWLAEVSGLVVVTGPAGSGKSTTAYAGLRAIARAAKGSRSLVSLEDPVEVVVAEVAQSQINLNAGFDLASGLRTVLRQDPEVIMIGEIRDAATCEVAFQAALTGHLILTTFHAGGVAEGVSRLLDMGLEPYVLRSGLRGIVSQRLLRRLCKCARPSQTQDERLGLPSATARIEVGCEACHQTCYAGRYLVAETLPPLEGELGAAVLGRYDAHRLQAIAMQSGMTTLSQAALKAVAAGTISPLEYRRVFAAR